MTILSVPPLIMAVIAFYISSYHFLIYIRRPKIRRDLTFSLTCLAIGIYNVCCVGNYNSAAPLQGYEWQRLQLASLGLICSALIWFVADYTERKERKDVYAFNIFFLLCTAVELFDRSSLTWLTDQPLVKSFTVLGHQITYSEVAQGPFTDLEAFALLVFFLYLFWLSVHFYWYKDPIKGLPLVLAITVFFVTICEDVLVSAGFYQFVYTIEYGYIGLALIMTYTLSSQIIESVKWQEELLRSEKKYRTLLDNLPQRIFYKDCDSVYISCNENYASDLGVTPEEIVGKTDYDLHSRELADLYRADDQRILESKETETFEEPYIYQGEERIAQTTKRVVFDNQGNALGILGIFLDVTDQKKMEQKLVEVQKMDSIGILAGGIAHDFNNMLTAILSSADLLMAKETDEKKKELLKTIVNASTRSSDLTSKLLAFSRRGKNLMQPVMLRTLIDEASQILKRTMDKSIVLKVNLAEQPCMIDGDSSQIYQVIMNLCVNAVEAMPKGGRLTIEEACVQVDDAFLEHHIELQTPDCVLLTVSDSGKGIPPGIRERMFEPFFTTKDTASKKGSGLGLATVYGIVHNHGGVIEVKTEKGEGTTFKIYFPRGSQTAGQASTDEEQPKETISRGTVLVIDDEEFLRVTAEDVLDELGYSAVCVEDGIQGIDYYRDHWQEIRVVLLDLVMPGKGGKETFVALKAINPDVCTIISTGYGFDGRIQEILDLGAKCFLKKPFRPQDLEQALETAQEDTSS